MSLAVATRLRPTIVLNLVHVPRDLVATWPLLDQSNPVFCARPWAENEDG